MRDTGFLDRVFLAASAFGAGLALGLLIAPDAGRDTRGRLASGARDVAHTAQDRGRDLVAPVGERVRETADALAQRHLPLADDFEIIDPQSVRDALR